MSESEGDDNSPLLGLNHGLEKASLAVLAAAIGNTVVWIAKSIAILFDNSGSIYNEMLHSGADAFNQWFLLVCLVWLGSKWRIAPVIIYAVISIIAVSHGYHILISPQPVKTSSVSLVVLAISFIVESGTLVFAFKKMNGHGQGLTKRLWNAHLGTLFIIIEDSIAVLGVLTAGISLRLANSHPWYDGVGSLLIGCLMMLGSFVLIVKYLFTIKYERKVLKDQSQVTLHNLEVNAI